MTFELSYALRQLRKLPAWLWELHWLWLLFLGPVVLLIVFDWGGYAIGADRAGRLAYAGGALQLIGIALIGWRLRLAERKAGRQTVPEFLRAWIARFPLLNQDRNVLAGSVRAELATSEGRIETWAVPKDGDDLGERVEALERNVQRLRENVRAERDRVTKELRDIRETRHKDHEANEEAHKELHDSIEAARFGDIHLEWRGVFWIGAGIVLSTFSAELVYLFGWLYWLLEWQ